MNLEGTEPILCSQIIRQVDQHLIELLTSLDASEWDLPAITPQWSVRDVAAHLLDTALRKLSRGRDKCRVDSVNVRSHQDVITLVNRLNHEGVTVYRRLSPKVLTQLMQLVCNQTADFYESLDPFAPAAIGVSWAGEMTSLVWFDNARELTERWHHQEQIRLATNRPGIMTPLLYHPVLDTFLRGLPHAYRDVTAADNTALLVEISGDCGGQWCLVRSHDTWSFTRDLPSAPVSHIIIPQSIAWRIFTKGIDRESARAKVTITGDKALAEHVLQLVAIVG
ncbi:MAG: hypothetical protein QOE55_2483 [Acidobacteriaceae bacterium]|nr:hypothetical protein [Acidobacteriaceae bacterium]